MTVENKIHYTMSLLKTASGSLATFAFDTKDTDAKQFYMDAAQEIDTINAKLKDRMETVRTEEPPPEGQGEDTGTTTTSGLLRRRPIKKL